MVWNGERQRHSMAKRKILTAKGLGKEYEDAGGTYYESDETRLDRRWKILEEKANDYFMKGDFEKYVKIIKFTFEEQCDWYDVPNNEKESFSTFRDVLRAKALSYMDENNIPSAKYTYRNLIKLPTIQPTISTLNGTGYYAGTEIESDNGKWNNIYENTFGEYVIHDGNLHHLYLNNKTNAGVIQ